MKNKLISDIGEKGLIKILLNRRDDRLKSEDNLIKKSYHDDAAIIHNTNEFTVISTDMLFQHSHFPKQMTYYQMGAKAVTVNVSDILAMNADSTSILISMGLPAKMTLKEYEELTNGILDKCDEYNIKLIGGDINQSDEIVLCGTSVGKVDQGIKLQTGIENGNLIGITGELGGPAAALDLLNFDKKSFNNEENRIINTLLSPSLPIKESEILKKYPEIITSITDITDGLAVELGHLKDKNPNIGFEICFDKLPYDKTIDAIAKRNNKNILEYLLHFGEEFELLITLNEKKYFKHEKELSDITIIGKTNNSGKISLIKDGEEEIIPIKGYEHLKVD